MEQSAEDSIRNNKGCLGIMFNKDEKNPTVRVTSIECSQKKEVICSLDAANVKARQKLLKFPCVPQISNLRRKRELGSDQANKNWNGKNYNLLIRINDK